MLDQFELYAPGVLESFKELAATGSVEFLSETDSHSLASLVNKEEFELQVKKHNEKIKRLFGQEPKVLANTELIYSDEIGAMAAEMGFKGILTEGAKHVLGWKSPNYLYYNARNPKLKVLLKNYELSDDIAFRFSDKGWAEYPLTAEKYVQWLNEVDKKEETVNLFMDYETFGEHQWEETGIFKFLEALPGLVLSETNYEFHTPSELADKLQPIAAIHAPHPISWADTERDLTAWLGNDLQEEAFNKLYHLKEKIKKIEDPKILIDWKYLQSSDHLYYMCTKFFSDGAVHSYFNPYHSPYDAFINYMNILSDFTIRVNSAVPETTEHVEISNLNDIIRKKDEIIKKYETELKTLRKQKRTSLKTSDKEENVKKGPVKNTAKKTQTRTSAKKPATSTKSKKNTKETTKKTTSRKTSGPSTKKT
jgi:alpha-amylase